MPNQSESCLLWLGCLSTLSNLSGEVFRTLFGVSPSLSNSLPFLSRLVWSDRGRQRDEQQCSARDTRCHCECPSKPFLIHARAQGFVASLAETLCLTAVACQSRPLPQCSKILQTPIVLGRSMLSRFKRWFSWVFNHTPPQQSCWSEEFTLYCLYNTILTLVSLFTGTYARW